MMKNVPILAALATLAAVVTLPTPAARGYAVTMSQGDSGGILKWDHLTVPYVLHPACSEDLDSATCLGELRASFAVWTAPCAGLVFQEGDPSSNLQLTSLGGATNGKNELAFIESQSWAYGNYVLGVTGPVFSPSTGTIHEADIAFNGLHHKWTVGSMGFATVDVRNVAVHEIGHFFGLQHVLHGYDAADPPSMIPTADQGLKTQTPEADDLAGLCFLYPADSHACTSDADCPYILDQGNQGEFYHGILACTEGLCGGISTVIPGGDVGETCLGDADCADGLRCVSGTCTTPCTTDADCPPPSICSGSTCHNPTSSGPSHQDELTPCGNHFDCLSGGFDLSNLGICVPAGDGSYCRQVCQQDAECFGCLSCQLGAQVAFFGDVYGCIPTDGCAEAGELCTGDAECATGTCLDQGCVEACTVLGDDPCPDDEACARFDDTTLEGICAPKGALEDESECTRDDLCASLMCIGGVCKTPCNQDTSDPCGDLCEVGEGPFGLCAPEPEPPKGGGGGCALGHTPQSAPIWMLLALLSLVPGRSRPRSAARPRRRCGLPTG